MTAESKDIVGPNKHEDAILEPMRQSPLIGGVSPQGRDAAPMEEGQELRDLWLRLRRRWRLALAVFIVVSGATGVLYKSATPKYEASSSLRFDTKTSGVQVPGLALGGLPDLDALSTEIIALKAYQLSRDVAEILRLDVSVVEPEGVTRNQLVDEVTIGPGARRGTYKFTRRGEASFEVIAPDGRTATIPVADTASVMGLGFRILPSASALQSFSLMVRPIDAVAATLNREIEIRRPNRDAQVLEVRYRSPDIVLAKQVPDVTVQRFIARQTERLQLGSTSAARFIADQLRDLESQLAVAEGRLRDWRQRFLIVQPEAEAGMVVQRRAGYEAELAKAREEVLTIEGLLTSDAVVPPGARPLSRYRRVLSSPVVAQGQVASAILGSILELEAKRAELLGTFTEQDPQVKLVEQTIADYERQGEQFVSDFLSMRRAQVASLERLLGAVGDALDEVPTRELELKTLQRDVEVLSELQFVLRQRLKESEIAIAADMPTIEVLDTARTPTFPVTPSTKRYLALGLLLALSLAIAAAVISDVSDRTIHSVEALERATNLMMVGMIPSFSTRKPTNWRQRWRRRQNRIRREVQRYTGGSADLIAAREPRHVSSEAYRTLRANLLWGVRSDQSRVLAFSSASPGDGKSTTTSNLAVVMATQGKKVIVLDADLRKGTQHVKLGGNGTVGMTDVLRSGEAVSEVIPRVLQRLELSAGTTIDYIASGKPPENPTELLGDDRWAQVLTWARAHYDVVLCDTPPVNMFADALVAAALVDGLVLVARAAKSRLDEVSIAASQIRALGIPLIGAVLNDFQVERDGRYGNYRYYRYYYSSYYEHYAPTNESASNA